MIKWEIRTRDTLNAGTDARVYLLLKGDRGVLPEAELIDSDSYNNWERGDVNGGTLQTSAEIGNITSGTLRQDGSGIGPDWQVESVKITSQGVDFIAPVYAELKRNKPVHLLFSPVMQEQSEELPVTENMSRLEPSQEDFRARLDAGLRAKPSAPPEVAPMMSQSQRSSDGRRSAQLTSPRSPSPMKVDSKPVAQQSQAPRKQSPLPAKQAIKVAQRATTRSRPQRQPEPRKQVEAIQQRAPKPAAQQLSAEEQVGVLRRGGFSDAQILDFNWPPELLADLRAQGFTDAQILAGDWQSEESASQQNSQGDMVVEDEVAALRAQGFTDAQILEIQQARAQQADPQGDMTSEQELAALRAQGFTDAQILEILQARAQQAHPQGDMTSEQELSALRAQGFTDAQILEIQQARAQQADPQGDMTSEQELSALRAQGFTDAQILDIQSAQQAQGVPTASEGARVQVLDGQPTIGSTPDFGGEYQGYPLVGVPGVRTAEE